MDKYDIITYARELRGYFGTRDPFYIAEHFGITITESSMSQKVFKAKTIRFPGYPTLISIGSGFSEKARTVLCAHELGHALLHNGSFVNAFNGTKNDVYSSVEYEANLFAAALLFDNEDFNIPLENMSEHSLKYLIEYNID